MVCGMAAAVGHLTPSRADEPMLDDGARAVESLKRRAPKIDPVVANGVRYEVTPGPRNKGFKQNSGVISAVDVATARVLWSIAVYPVFYEAGEETDVQDVFITELKLGPDGKTLLVTNEAGKRFSVKLEDQTVTAF